MNIPRASFEHTAATVWFESGDISRDTLRELFGVVGLNAYNIAIRRDDVMGMEDTEGTDGQVGFQLLPDNEVTRTHGPVIVDNFNKRLEEYHDISPDTVQALIDRAKTQAGRGY